MLFAAWIWLCFNVVFCLGCVLGDRCWFKRGHTKSISFGRRVLWNLVNQCWFIDCSSVVHLFWVGEGHKSLWPDIKVSLWPHASVPSSTAERWLRRTGMTGSVKAFEVGPISELEWLFALSRKYVDTLSRKHVDSLQNLSLGLGAPENVNRLKRVNFVVRKPREWAARSSSSGSRLNREVVSRREVVEEDSTASADWDRVGQVDYVRSVVDPEWLQSSMFFVPIMPEVAFVPNKSQ